MSEVFETLRAALGEDADSRRRATETLSRWERSAAPGFLASLATVASQQVGDEARLLATISLKNCVGSTWRKTLASREWMRVPEGERAFVRATALSLLLHDPSHAVALHAALLVSNVARFDAPRRWPELLETLLEAGRDGGQPERQARALKALKHVLTALTGTRASSGAAAAAMDAEATHGSAGHLLSPLAELWRSALLAVDLRLASRALAALRPLLRLLPSLQHPAVRPLFEQALATLQRPAGDSLADPLADKHSRLLLETISAAQDVHPLEFAPFLAPFVLVFASTMLQLPPNALIDHPKRAHTLTRFLANVLLCTSYRAAQGPHRPDSPPPLIPADDLIAPPPLPPAEVDAQAQAAVEAASCAIAPLLEGDAFVRALIERYLVPTPAELDEWRSDPEALLAQGEPAAAGAEGDSARPCAETLLLCLTLRDRQKVSAIVLGLAQQAQQSCGAEDAASVLFRDGVYRALGVLAPELPAGTVDVWSWARAELLPLLAEHAGCADAARRGDAQAQAAAHSLPRRLLAARALWLLGRFAEELVAPKQLADGGQRPDDAAQGQARAQEAAVAALPHLSPDDPLLALHAAAALRSLASAASSHVSAAVLASRRRALSSGAEARTRDTARSVEAAAASAASDAVAPWALPALSRALGLLPALAEPETTASVLRLCAMLIDLLGRARLAPHAPTLVAALPPVWQAVEARCGGTPGAAARVHAALLGTLAHLVTVLGTDAFAHESGVGVGGILFPMLAFSTDPTSASFDALMEDGVQLWLAALRASTGALHPSLLALTPRLLDLLRRDPSTPLVLVCQGYILVGGADWTRQHCADMVAALTPPLLATEPSAEDALLASSAACEMSLQVAGAAVLPHLAGALRDVCPRLALMLGGDGGAAAQDAAAAELIPTARAAKSYVQLLARACVQAPSALRELCASAPGLAEDVTAVWAELGSLRTMDELLSSGANSRLAEGGGLAPSPAMEDRHVSAAALCSVLIDAASAAGAGADATSQAPVASAAGGILRRCAAVVALLLQALYDLKLLNGDEGAQGTLPVEAWRGGGGDESLPNMVDLNAWKLACADPVRAVALRARACAAVQAVRGCVGDEWLMRQLTAEERLADLAPPKQALLHAILTGAA